MNRLNQLLQDKFSDPNFLSEYYRKAVYAKLADQLLLLRKQRKITQKELAKKMETTQAVVSRLENASGSPSIETITKFAEALDAIVEINIILLEELPSLGPEKKAEKHPEESKETILRTLALHADIMMSISEKAGNSKPNPEPIIEEKKLKPVQTFISSAKSEPPNQARGWMIPDMDLSFKNVATPINYRKRVKEFAG